MSDAPSARITGPWHHMMELMLESTSHGVCGVDTQGHCVFINRAGAEMLGHRAEDLLGRNIHETIHHSHCDGRHYPSADCPIFRSLNNGESCRIEDEVLWRKDGSAFHAEYSPCPIFENGQITGVVVTFADISERRLAQEQQQRLREELEQRVASRTQELSQALEELRHTTESLRELSAHAEQAREQDRSRIAREIHDELGSVLVALKLDLSWLGQRLQDRPDLVTKTVSMRRLIDKAVVEVGRIITDLRPSILDHQGLWAAMEWHAQDFLDATGLQGRLRLDRLDDQTPPEGALATAAYRIFQEMLNNVARHAQASAVDICVCSDSQTLSIEVSDNGRGITAEELENPRSYGLIGMSERARHFGGGLSIAAAEGGGTRVRVSLPYSFGVDGESASLPPSSKPLLETTS